MKRFGSYIRETLNRNLRLRKFLASAEQSPLIANRFVELTHFHYARLRAPKLAKLPPSEVVLETASVCNARCIMCGYPEMQRAKTFMEMELFRKIVGDVKAAGGVWINLQFYGEPLLDKNLFERVRYIKDKGLKVRFNTNASLLDETKARSYFKTLRKTIMKQAI